MKLKFLFPLLLINFLIFDSLISLVTANGADIIAEIKEQIIALGCWLLGLLLLISGAVAALFIVLSGIKYMASESTEERYEARTRLTYALIGLIVILIAIPLVNYFISTLNSVVEGFEIPIVDCTEYGVPIGPDINLFDILEELICRIIALVYYLTATIAALVLVYAGIKYTTAESLDERESAKRTAVNVIVGLIIVLIAMPLIGYLIHPYKMLNCEEYLEAQPTTPSTPTEPSLREKCINCIDTGKVWCTVDDVCYDTLSICHGLGCSGSCITSVSACPEEGPTTSSTDCSDAGGDCMSSSNDCREACEAEGKRDSCEPGFEECEEQECCCICKEEETTTSTIRTPGSCTSHTECFKYLDIGAGCCDTSLGLPGTCVECTTDCGCGDRGDSCKPLTHTCW